MYHFQDIFHSTTHWLQDFGIFTKIMDPYLNAEPLIPLPKVRINEAFTVEQLIMLWLIWAIGLILGSDNTLFQLEIVQGLLFSHI